MKNSIPMCAAAAILLAGFPGRAAEPETGTGAKPDGSPMIEEHIALGDGRYSLVIDTSGTPDLAEWVRTAIVPMAAEWYPKLVSQLPSEGFSAPAELRIIFDPDMGGVAGTSGTRIRCGGDWMRANREGEAVGAVFHELVHVVQQYGHGPHRAPGWLVEGIADYLRWFVFEPQSNGARIAGRQIERARYDGSYRVTANFLDWLCRQHGADMVTRLNAAIREGRYHEAIWQDFTGQDPEALDAAWKRDLTGHTETP